MNVFDWLGGMPLAGRREAFPYNGSFLKLGSRKEFFRNSGNAFFQKATG